MYDIKNFNFNYNKDEMISQKELETLKEISNNKEYENFFTNLKSLNLKYIAGMMEIKTKIEILNEDFKIRYKYNPIKTIQTRLKSPESIVKKMQKMNLDITLNNINGNIHDIAGVRIICKYIPDIYRIAEMLKQDDTLEIIKEKDYVTNPKKSGYRSYHLVLLVPIRLTTGDEKIPVEIQIRTMSMDFWASLEHEIAYKYDGEIPKDAKEALISTSEEIEKLDDKFYQIKQIILNNNKEDNP